MDWVQEVFGHDLQSSLLIILNLILIESLLSVDNAAVLATMVMDLPKDQRKKALKYGILGAYILRGVCLIFAAFIIKIWWLKSVGGLYLVYLAVHHFYKMRHKKKEEQSIEEEIQQTKKSKLYRMTIGALGTFWTTVILIEIMDLAFSIDNVFAAVAFTDNIYLICIGVFIGILAMRFVAQYFVRLMNKFPFLEIAAFLVILVLGLKLTIAGACHIWENTPFCKILNSEAFDLVMSLLTVCIFVLPILSSFLFNFPKRKEINKDTE